MNKPIIELADGTKVYDIDVWTENLSSGYCETCYYEYTADYLRLTIGEDDYLSMEINSMSMSVGSYMRLFGNYYEFLKSLNVEQLFDLLASFNMFEYYGSSLGEFISQLEWMEMYNNIS